MNQRERIAQLEIALRKVWGYALFMDSLVDDPKMKEAFVKVDGICKRTGLMADKEAH